MRDKPKGIINPLRIQLSRDKKKGIKYEIGLPKDYDEIEEPPLADQELQPPPPPPV